MKLCIIENELSHANHLLQILHRWEVQNGCSLKTDVFTSGECLLSKKVFDYHAIFLDIQLNGLTGIEIAKRLRERQYQNELIFLTAYREYVFEGYDVHACNYILKPATYEKIDSCMQYLKEKLNDSHFIYRYKNTIAKIPYHKILYFTSRNQYTEIVTKENAYKQAEPLKNILKSLPVQFVQCHRTLIVNIQQIHSLQGKNIYLSTGELLPVSNTYLNTLQNAFLQHISFRK